ncbi:hypothetical protein SAMN05216197_114107 [Pseudomonas graminis]|uniref:Uncharacterized protein n=1 Tax=Pseudomonas graminis TaxID=158627 RepID=A0A1I0ETS9_9PSED|nr:hypothetical protein SAMN05216197_114107 [Pseudomonas graminis]
MLYLENMKVLVPIFCNNISANSTAINLHCHLLSDKLIPILFEVMDGLSRTFVPTYGAFA